MTIMKKILASSLILIITVFSFHSLTYAQAANPSVASPSNNQSVASPSNATNANNAATSQALNIHLNNPLAVSTINDAIKLFMGVIIRIALPLIIIMFIWSGLTFVFARGNPRKIDEAKNILLFTIIGALLILGAWTITNAIVGTVNSIMN